MNNNPFQQEQTSLKEIDFKYYFFHYVKLLWKWKWYALISGPIAGAIAVFAVLHLGFLKYPPMPATAFIGIDTPKSKGSDDFGGSSVNKERLLLNRAFIQDIVKKLSLQLAIDEHSRYELFDSVEVDSTAPFGSFNFEIDKENRNTYKILFTNKNLNAKNKVVESGNLSSLDRLLMPGIFLKFNDSFLKNPHDFNFSIVPLRYAIDRTIGKMKVTSPNIREQQFFFSVTLEGTDYPLVTQTVNTIVDLFIENNLTSRKRMMQEAITELEKQLSIAEIQQSQSKAELRNFLAKNPSVGLSQSTQQTMSELISLETGSFESTNLIDELQNLKSNYGAAPADEKSQVISEMIVFLQTHGSLAAPSLQANLAQYTAEKESALQNYSKSHPIFAEIEGKFASLNSRTIQAIDAYINQLKKALVDRNYSIQKVTSKLQGLPSQELQLAELQKKQDIDAEIYSKLLARYNEAKVAETVRGGDVYIMEYAVQPIAPSLFLQYAKSAGIIAIAILFFAFGPAIALDFVDKTVRSEQSLTRMLPYRFLETIPVIKLPSSKKLPPEKNSSAKSLVQEILITNPGIQPPSVVENFRSLATKILLDYYQSHDHSFVVTSFEMDEGKSTVAANIAISMAQQGVKTVLIDCDLRRGVAHKILSVNKNPGLSEYLINVSIAANQQYAQPVQIPMLPTSIQNLWIIPSGTTDDNPQRLLRSQALAALKQRLINDAFFIIFDSPPVAVAADAAALSNLASKYVLVIKAGQTNVVNLKKIITKDYPMIHEKVLGVVLNMGENTVPSRYYSYYLHSRRKPSHSDT